MGRKISAKQAALFTIINYIGVAIGVVSTVLIYPQNKEMLGIVRFVDAWAQILFPIMVLGSTNALINFYPTLSKKLQEKLFGFSLLSIAKISIFLGVLLLFYSVYATSENKIYLWYAYPLAIFMAYIEIFKRQATHLQKLSVPTFYEKIIPKIALPAVFLLVISAAVSISHAIWWYVFAYGVVVVLVGRYVYLQDPFRLSKHYDELFKSIPKKKYYAYSLYSFAGSFGAFFAFRVDSLMIPEFISFEANGTYSIGVTLASTLAIPATGVFALYAPVISDYIKQGAWKELNNKYKEVCKTLFFIGAVLFSCVFVGIEPLFKLLPTYESLAPSIPIIYLLGINVVINMATGFNTEIISYSKYYRFNLLAILSLMVLNVVLNWLFLTQTNFGIQGVAYASLASLMLYNISKTLFIYSKMKLWPFDLAFLKMFLFILVVASIVFLLPITSYSLGTLLYKVTLIVVFDLFVVYKFNWAPSVTYGINQIIEKIKSFLP